MLHYDMLQSGSSGNSCLIKTDKTSMLIDVGLTYKELTKRLNELGSNIEDIDAILITHEHIDHIKCIDSINHSKVYSTKETLPLISCNYVEVDEEIEINELKIKFLSISHDVKNGVGFVISDKDSVISYMTDTGYIKSKNIKHMKNSTHYIIESNYDDDLLMSSSRPVWLKERIRCRRGHMSNEYCGQMLTKLIGPNTKSIMLSHISQDCNNVEVCYQTINSILNQNNVDTSNIVIKIASRSEITRGM